MKIRQKQFRIGQLAKHIGVERFVIRFWEKEFCIAGDRSSGGQRFYAQKDLETFQSIKKLLYQDGFTIAGAKQQLSNSIIPARTIEQKESANVPELKKELINLRQKLIALKDVL